MDSKMKKRYQVALRNAQTLEYQLAMLCGYVDDPDISRDAISCLLGVALELASPVVNSIETWAEAEGLSNG